MGMTMMSGARFRLFFGALSVALLLTIARSEATNRHSTSGADAGATASAQARPDAGAFVLGGRDGGYPDSQNANSPGVAPIGISPPGDKPYPNNEVPAAKEHVDYLPDGGAVYSTRTRK